jgi:hypothetical protein
MNNLFTFKGRAILFLLLVFQFGLKLQASANTRMVCDTDTTKKAAAINSQTIKADTTLTLKAGSVISTIVKNSDTTMIINGVTPDAAKNSDVKTDPATTLAPGATSAAKADNAKADSIKKGLIEVKNNEPTTTSFTAPPTDGTVQVKNTATAPPTNTAIIALPTDGVIQVKDNATTPPVDGAGQGNPNAGVTEQADSTNAKKAGTAAAGTPDAATTGTPDAATTGTSDAATAGKADAATTGKTDTTTNAKPGAATAGKIDASTGAATATAPINGVIEVKAVDTTKIKKADTTLMRKSDTTAMMKDTTDSSQIKAKGYYLEVGGPGLAISANYDARFNKTRDGWGYRIGLGGFVSGGNRVITVPFQVNYLIGEHSSMFEVGAGTTFLNSTGDNKGKTWEFDKITGFVATCSIGYRYQPEHKGINFRIAFVPILYDEGIIPAGGISVGYTFK